MIPNKGLDTLCYNHDYRTKFLGIKQADTSMWQDSKGLVQSTVSAGVYLHNKLRGYHKNNQ
jgi:hypothetical protein